MSRRELDLFLVVVSSLVLTALILAIPSVEAVQIVLALPLALFLPGYTLVAALFPRKGDLDPSERIALSVGLSIAIVPLTGLALNYSPWGVRLDPILAFVTLFIVLAAVAAVLRRRLLPPDEAFGLVIHVRGARSSRTRLASGFLTLVLVLSAAGLGVAAFVAATSRGDSERFTDFYVLGAGGKAEDYPSQVKAGESATVVLGVANHEGEDIAYRIAVMIDGENSDSIDNLLLADGESWENRIELDPAHASDDQKVEFLLYKDGESDPYRSLRLFLDVNSAVAEAVHPPEEAPSPTPSPEPMPEVDSIATPPDGFIYVVQAGDTLATLAEHFGLGAEVIAAANDLAESESLPVGGKLVIPGVIHTVRPGETLHDIAAAFDVSLNVIMAVNGIEGQSTITAGQELVIPGG
jgi:uncharacterized membrane protein/LysM repeat protein